MRLLTVRVKAIRRELGDDPRDRRGKSLSEKESYRNQRFAREVFFSEEKNQKTFMSSPLRRSRPWPRWFREPRN
jgi:hypothetical protein